MFRSRHNFYFVGISLAVAILFACSSGTDEVLPREDSAAATPTPDPWMLGFVLTYMDQVSVRTAQVHYLMGEDVPTTEETTLDFLESWLESRVDATRELADATDHLYERISAITAGSQSCDALKESLETARQSTLDLSAAWARFARFEIDSEEELWPKTNDAWSRFNDSLFELETTAPMCDKLDITPITVEEARNSVSP